jgi:hypothetical protein
MVSRYEIVPELRSVIIRYRGLISNETVLRMNLGYLADAGFRPDFHILCDVGHCDFPRYTYLTTRRLVEGLQPLFDARSPRSRTAFFAPDDHAFACVRMYEMISDSRTDRQIGIFRKMKTALRFLDIDPDDHAVTSRLWPETALSAG